jgi:hypothetical protein
MADDNDGQQEEGGSSFGVVTEREEPEGEPVSTKKTEVKTEESKETEVESEGTEEGKTETGTEETKEDGKEGKTELTEKGTKLDPNPASAVHQELANEKKIRSNYEKVLADPTLLAKFAKEQYGIDLPVAGGAKTEGEKEGEAGAEAIKEFEGKDFESLDDVAKVVNGLRKSFVETHNADKQEIAQLKETVQGLLQGGRVEKTSTNIAHDIQALQALPELTKGNPDYIEGLEEKIVNEYHRIDSDGKGFYKGEHSLKEIADRFLDIAKTARKAGSQSAQTIVKDKTRGAVKTGPATTEEEDTSEMSPSDSIASGIAKTFGR